MRNMRSNTSRSRSKSPSSSISFHVNRHIWSIIAIQVTPSVLKFVFWLLTILTYCWCGFTCFVLLGWIFFPTFFFVLILFVFASFLGESFFNPLYKSLVYKESVTSLLPPTEYSNAHAFY